MPAADLPPGGMDDPVPPMRSVFPVRHRQYQRQKAAHGLFCFLCDCQLYKAQNKYPDAQARRTAVFADAVRDLVQAWRDSRPASSEIHGIVHTLERQYRKHVMGRFNNAQPWTRDSILFHLTHVDAKNQLRHELIEQKDRFKSAAALLMSHAFVQPDPSTKAPDGGTAGEPPMVVDPKMLRAWVDTEKMLAASLSTLSAMQRTSGR